MFAPLGAKNWCCERSEHLNPFRVFEKRRNYAFLALRSQARFVSECNCALPGAFSVGSLAQCEGQIRGLLMKRKGIILR